MASEARERSVIDEEQHARHAAIVSDHIGWMHTDPDLWEMPDNYREGRVKSETRGLYTFLEADVRPGDYVNAGYRRGQEDLEIAGPLNVFQPHDKQHPLWIFVRAQRIRFRALNWIEKAENPE